MKNNPILKPFSQHPPSQYAEVANLASCYAVITIVICLAFVFMLRDNFKTSTWILIGACLQSLILMYMPGYVGFAPAFVFLGWRIADVLLMTAGLKHNHYMDGVIPGKWAAQFPDEKGEYTGEPANAEVCVIILGARCNHPLGMFAPGYKTIFNYFNANVVFLEAAPEENGWLGMSGWLNSGDRSTGSEAMMIGYFKDVESLHKFAHGKNHREGWNWWNRTIESHPYLSIMHEVYYVPKKSWETIYINYHPTGLAATSRSTSVGGDGTSSPDKTTTWFSPIVEAHKGAWRSSAGRMARDDGTVTRIMEMIHILMSEFKE